MTERRRRLLGAGATSGLRTTARQVCELAAAGVLPERGPEPRPFANRGLVTITAPADIARAHDQLVNLLRTAGHVRAERLGVMAIGQLRTCRALLEVVPENRPELRTALEQHERALTEVTRHPVRVASLTPGDPRPLQQMQIIRQAVTAGSPLLQQLAEEPAEVAKAAASLAGVTCALQETSDRQLAAHSWLVPDHSAEEQRWRAVGNWHEVPAQLQALRAAAVQTEQVLTAAGPDVTPRPKPPEPVRASARDLLRPAPFGPLIPSRYGVRPTRPSQPVAVRPATHPQPRRR